MSELKYWAVPRSCPLRPVKRQVRVREQAFGVCAVLWIHSDTDAQADMERLSVKIDLFCNNRQ